jgi:hypothetical protein
MPHSRDSRDLASFATALAGELPGNWASDYHRHNGYRDQFPLAEDVWDMNMVSDAIAVYALEHDAVLTGEDGTRLYVIGHPRQTDEFLVGAMAPPGFDPEAFRGVREPDGIAVPDDPFHAAADITTRLLPRYDQAVAQVRHNAARLAPPAPDSAPDSTAERVVMTWTGDGELAAKPESQQASKPASRRDPARDRLHLPSGRAGVRAVQ